LHSGHMIRAEDMGTSLLKRVYEEGRILPEARLWALEIRNPGIRMAALHDSGLSLPKPPGFALTYRQQAAYVSYTASRFWTARPTSPANEPTRTRKVSDPCPRAQTTKRPRYPSEPHVKAAENALLSAGHARGSEAVSTATAERAVTAVSRQTMRTESQHSCSVAGAASVITVRIAPHPYL
jgi:hypothetical protein